MCKSVAILSKIAEIRASRNMSQLELALELRLDPSLLRRIEGVGHSESAYISKTINIELLDKMCKFFNCQPGDLFVYQPDEQQ